jgi:hypothetical protein
MGILELAGAEARLVSEGFGGTTEVVPFPGLLELERFSLLGAKFRTILVGKRARRALRSLALSQGRLRGGAARPDPLGKLGTGSSVAKAATSG